MRSSTDRTIEGMMTIRVVAAVASYPWDGRVARLTSGRIADVFSGSGSRHGFGKVEKMTLLR